MELEKNKRKEPGIGKLALGALALGLAILVGFVVGLRMGDRIRSNPSGAETEIVEPVDTTAVDEPSAQPDTAAVAPAVPVEPESGNALSRLSKQEIAQGVEYLASHNRWNREEMEKIAALAGLWDAINVYDIAQIRQYNDVLASTPLTAIVEGLDRRPKEGFYASKNDQVITLSTYIKRLR